MGSEYDEAVAGPVTDSVALMIQVQPCLAMTTVIGWSDDNTFDDSCHRKLDILRRFPNDEGVRDEN